MHGQQMVHKLRQRRRRHRRTASGALAPRATTQRPTRAPQPRGEGGREGEGVWPFAALREVLRRAEARKTGRGSRRRCEISSRR